jgi:CMP-N-acetylneuraminic acid synthetase
LVKKRIIAVIPARGGSKRIPRKNAVDFCGKPMIAWTIEAARSSALFDRILVSTDSPEIAGIAEEHGGEAPFLRDRMADDSAPVAHATLVALEQAQSHWNEQYDVVVQLMPNCPLRDSNDIVATFDRFRQSSAPFLVTCFAYGWMNPWWAHRVDEHGQATPLFKEALSRRSQDLETLYCPSGAIWIADVAALKASRTFYAPGHIFHPIGWMSAVDIDDTDDLDMARAVNLVRRDRAAV